MTSAQLKLCRRFQRVTKGTAFPAERLPALAGWQSLSQEDIAAARDELERTVPCPLVDRILWNAPLVAFLAVFLVSLQHLYGGGDSLGASFCNALFYGMLAGMNTLFVVMPAIEAHSGNCKLKVGLAPANDAYRCEEAIAVVQGCPELIAYRDDIVGRGRALTNLDVDYIVHRGKELVAEAHERELAALPARATPQ